MGIITSEKVDQLWWMGRYTERAFTSTKLLMKQLDEMIDKDRNSYIAFCEKMGVPNVFRSPESFITDYAFDESNPFSIISSIVRALDNAIILRETIGSETLAYLQLVLDELRKHSLGDKSDYLRLQHAIDLILAFWGSVEDNVLDEPTRNIARAGKRLERLDLCLRSGDLSGESLVTSCRRLRVRLERSAMPFNNDNLSTLEAVLTREPVNRDIALSLLSKVLDA